MVNIFNTYKYENMKKSRIFPRDTIYDSSVTFATYVMRKDHCHVTEVLSKVRYIEKICEVLIDMSI